MFCIGHYCPDGQAAECASDVTDPVPCGLPAYYCMDGIRHTALNGEYTTCAAGLTGCASHTRTHSAPCPPGHFCLGGLMTECAPGSYAEHEGQDICEYAPPGYHTARAGATAPETCPEGFYCPGNGAAMERCVTLGTYCPLGSELMNYCPPGAPQHSRPHQAAVSHSHVVHPLPASVSCNA